MIVGHERVSVCSVVGGTGIQYNIVSLTTQQTRNVCTLRTNHRHSDTHSMPINYLIQFVCSSSSCEIWMCHFAWNYVFADQREDDEVKRLWFIHIGTFLLQQSIYLSSQRTLCISRYLIVLGLGDAFTLNVL